VLCSGIGCEDSSDECVCGEFFTGDGDAVLDRGNEAAWKHDVTGTRLKSVIAPWGGKVPGLTCLDLRE
jgi:hypothetical protein